MAYFSPCGVAKAAAKTLLTCAGLSLLPSMGLAASNLCSLQSDNATDLRILNFAINGYSSGSLAESSTPNDITASSLITLFGGAGPSLTFNGYSTDANTTTAYTTLWLDFDHDGILESATELLLNKNTNIYGTTPHSQTFQIPNSAFNGDLQGRIILSDSSIASPCGTITKGSAVDFTLTIEWATDNPNAPIAPTGVTAVRGNNDGEAIVSFTPTASGVTTIEYLVTSVPDGITATGASSPITVTGLTDGTSYAFNVKAVGEAFNSPPSANSASILIGAPDASDPALDDTTNSGATTDTTTNNQTPMVTGSTEANATVRVYVGGTLVGSATAGADGSWTYTFAPGDLSEGDNAITTEVENTAGGVSARSTPMTLTMDTTLPTATFIMPDTISADPFSAQISFDEPVTGLTIDQLNATNATLKELKPLSAMMTADLGAQPYYQYYTVTVVPDGAGDVALSVTQNAAADTADNGNAAATSDAAAVDTDAPTLTITGPSSIGENLDPFEVVFTFSEPVTGFDQADIGVSGATIDSFTGSGSVYRAMLVPTGDVSLTIADGVASDGVGNTSVAASLAITTGTPQTAFDAVKDEVREIVQEQEIALLDDRLSSRREMVAAARERFVQQRTAPCAHERYTTDPERCKETVTRNSVPFDVSGSFDASAGAVTSNGTFFGLDPLANGMTRVVSGDFTVSMRDDGSRSSRLSGQIAWEEMRSEDTLLAYVLAADLADGTIDATLTGDSRSFSLSGGVYAVHAFSDHLYLDGYGTLGFGRTDMTLSNPTIALDGHHQGALATAGVSLTGVHRLNMVEFWPSLSLDFGYSDIGRVSFLATAFGQTGSVSLDAGQVSLADLRFTPEVKMPIAGPLGGKGSTALSLTPRLVCRYSGGTSDTRDCGGGIGLGLRYLARNQSAEFLLQGTSERIGSGTTNRIMLQYERKF